MSHDLRDYLREKKVESALIFRTIPPEAFTQLLTEHILPTSDLENVYIVIQKGQEHLVPSDPRFVPIPIPPGPFSVKHLNDSELFVSIKSGIRLIIVPYNNPRYAGYEAITDFCTKLGAPVAGVYDGAVVHTYANRPDYLFKHVSRKLFIYLFVNIAQLVITIAVTLLLVILSVLTAIARYVIRAPCRFVKNSLFAGKKAGPASQPPRESG